MTTQWPCVHLFKDLPEKVSSISIRRDLMTHTNVAVLRFQTLASLAHFSGRTKGSGPVLHLLDTEGDMLIRPTCIKLVYHQSEGAGLKSVECELEVNKDNHGERLMRFLQRYASAHHLVSEETESEVAFSADLSSASVNLERRFIPKFSYEMVCGGCGPKLSSGTVMRAESSKKIPAITSLLRTS